MSLRLRPTLFSDEVAFRAAHRSLDESDQYPFGLNFRQDEPFADFVARHRLMARGLELAEGLVPATFLVAIADDEIVGRVSIRHELNDFLRNEGGHIGYGVLRPFRRRGYATQMLTQSLTIARSLGVDQVLVTCDDDNVGSATVIERCGGRFIDRGQSEDGTSVRRYEIT